MGAKSERRSLYYESDTEFNPTLSVDVNEYLITNWPTLNLKQRTSVWTLCQEDEDFDYDSIHDQIDAWVLELAENDPQVNLGDISTDEDIEEDEEFVNDDSDDDEDLDGYLIVDVLNYASSVFPKLTEEQIFEVCDHMMGPDTFDWQLINTFIEEYFKKYAQEIDFTLDLNQISEPTETESTKAESEAE
tara:strand:+ start:92 stop:658 length:567 start_codon:yes stop_codon:yes gene_type:complete